MPSIVIFKIKMLTINIQKAKCDPGPQNQVNNNN